MSDDPNYPYWAKLYRDGLTALSYADWLTGGRPVPAANLPSDVRDGDLLTGTARKPGRNPCDRPALPEPNRLLEATVDDNPSVPLASEPIVFDPQPGRVYLVNGFRRILQATGNLLTDGHYTVDFVDAPTPPLPWVERPDSFWQIPGNRTGVIYHSAILTDAGEGPHTADVWQRVAVIPWDLIEQLRWAYDAADAYASAYPLGEILDAADGAS